MTEEEILITFDPMIYGVLQKGNVRYYDQHYDDYLQELRMLVLKRLREEGMLSPTNNNGLFTWLLWRLHEMLRSSQVRIFRESQPIVADIEPCSEADLHETNYRLLRENLLNTELSAAGVRRLLCDILNYPKDDTAARIKRLGISRAHYYRFLKQLQIDVNKFIIG